MAKFRYVIGGGLNESGGLKTYDKIKNVQYYQLIRKEEGGKEVVLARQEPGNHLFIAPELSHRVLIGAIGKDGKPASNLITLVSGDTSGQYFTPMVELTQDGYVYYLRFMGLMRVRTSTAGYLENVPFDGKLYLSSQDIVTKVKCEENMTIKADGIYLKISIDGSSKEVKVYDAIIDTAVVTEAVVWSVIEIHRAVDDYHRTEYIPVSVLTDDHNGYCFGAMSSSAYDSANEPIYKIAFYDENLSFLGGVRYSDITTYFKGAKKYLTKEEIGKLMASKLGESGYNTVKYLVFSSFRTGQDYDPPNNIDFVSIGLIYFPLFDTQYNVREGDRLIVRAQADGFFFRDSDSNEVVYTLEENS